MGGITKTLFGGSSNKSSATSNNQAFDFLKGSLAPNVQLGNDATSGISDFLGLGGADGTARAGAGLQNYMNSTGFNSMLDQGSRAITGSNAAKGLFQSGATGKALNTFGSNLAQQSTQNYMSNLQNLANLGLTSAQTIGGAGAQSTSTGKGGSQSGIIPGLFSDRRLKRNIKLLNTFSDGLGIYLYRYMWSPFYHIGVMADEVARLRPWALGKSVLGYATVRYDLLVKGDSDA